MSSPCVYLWKKRFNLHSVSGNTQDESRSKLKLEWKVDNGNWRPFHACMLQVGEGVSLDWHPTQHNLLPVQFFCHVLPTLYSARRDLWRRLMMCFVGAGFSLTDHHLQSDQIRAFCELPDSQQCNLSDAGTSDSGIHWDVSDVSAEFFSMQPGWTCPPIYLNKESIFIPRASEATMPVLNLFLSTDSQDCRET